MTRIKQQLSEAKGGIDTAEEALAVLQVEFEVNKILAHAGLYTD